MPVNIDLHANVDSDVNAGVQTLLPAPPPNLLFSPCSPDPEVPLPDADVDAATNAPLLPVLIMLLIFLLMLMFILMLILTLLT